MDGGTRPNTAVYNKKADVPAGVDVAGALSAYGTMGQGGNVWEWMETAADGTNTTSDENRNLRGGTFALTADPMRSVEFRSFGPASDNVTFGFRVASVPEPSTYALLLLGAGAMYLWKRRRDSL